ncbi:MAG TPA: DALR domain-containing protein, partial [Gaiellaceae bacterium]|nr:DALR domain-containing protein [Gaiellaceae bacterium]
VETIRDALDNWGREAILVFFLTASWRKPIDYSEETMTQAAARLETLRNAFTREAAEHEESGWQAFAAALDDDFDTPAALAVLHDWASRGQLELLRRGLAVFGLESLAERTEAPAEVVVLAERRLQARAERDFALWKANKPATEDTWWESPLGRGRPGWHIECSAMAEEIYGPAFEIHGGGLDLVFPHHENEVAQSRALGHPFAQIWAHNGMLQFTGEKMSKSSGKVETIRDAIDTWGRETILVFFLGGHWRKPIDYSPETMAQAAARLETLRNAFTREPAAHDESGWPAFADALDDDFDTPAALAVLHEWGSRGQLELLRRGLAVFGLGSLAERAEAPAEIVELAERRLRARAERDFETSDRLRDELAGAGWEMRDGSEGYDLVRI